MPLLPLGDGAAPHPPATDPRPPWATITPEEAPQARPGAQPPQPFSCLAPCVQQSGAARASSPPPCGDSRSSGHFPQRTLGLETSSRHFPQPPPQAPSNLFGRCRGPGRGGPRGGPGPQPGAVPTNPPAVTMSCAALLGLRGPRLLGAAAARPPRWSRRRSAGCEPPAGAAVRIGCASGFWGDTAAAGRRRGRRRWERERWWWWWRLPAGRPGRAAGAVTGAPRPGEAAGRAAAAASAPDSPVA